MPSSRRQGSRPRSNAGSTSREKAKQPSGTTTCFTSSAGPISSPIAITSAKLGATGSGPIARAAARMPMAMAPATKGAIRISVLVQSPLSSTDCAA